MKPIRLSKQLASKPIAPSNSNGEATPGFAAIEASPDGAAESGAGGEAQSYVASPDLVPVENDDPLKRRIQSYSRGNRWSRLFRKIFSKRQLTPEEQAEKAEMDARKAKKKLLSQEAKDAGRLIINRLDALGFCYWYPERRRAFGNDRKSVRILDYGLSDDALYIWLDTANLPRSVYIVDIMQENVLNELSLACRRRVLSKYSEVDGACYMVERASGIMGIPSHVRLKEMWDRMPVTAGRLSIPMGITTNSRFIWRDLGTMPHLLVAGTTGGGKSNMLNVIMVTLLQRNTPEQLKLLMIDLKGGLELKHYAGVPHMLPIADVEDGIATRIEQVPSVLGRIIQEAESRMHTISRAGFSDIIDYNARRATKNKMPRIILAFDELASLNLLNRQIGREAQALLTDIGNRGRAVGIHIIGCTQDPRKDVINSAVKSIMNAKMAFGCSTLTASMVILGNGDARGLAPIGRYVYQSGADQMVIQAPLFPKEHRDSMLDAIRGGTSVNLGTANHDVTQEEVMQWALQNTKGSLAIKRLYEEFRKRGITRDELLTWLGSWDGKQYRVGDAYYLVKQASSSQPRILVPVEETGADPV